MGSENDREYGGMASKSGKKTTASGRNSRKPSQRKGQGSRQYSIEESALFHEIGLIILFAVAVILFLCNFGVIGPAGDSISAVLFGIFGLTAYIAPAAVFLAAAFWSANRGNQAALRKVIAGIVLFIMIGVLCDFVSGPSSSAESYQVAGIYEYCSTGRKGGGVLAGSVAYLLYHFLDMVGAVLVVLVLSIISAVLVTERSFVSSMKNGGKKMVEISREDSERRKEYAQFRKQEQEELRRQKEEAKRLREEEKENEKILRMDRKVSGVMADTSLAKPEEAKGTDEIHEITFQHEITINEDVPEFDFDKIQIRGVNRYQESQELQESFEEPEEEEEIKGNTPVRIRPQALPASEEWTGQTVQANVQAAQPRMKTEQSGMQAEQSKMQTEQVGMVRIPKKYIFPPLSRLQKGKSGGADSTRELKETAARLQQTLNTFGVRVTITDISQGPAVTRYELQPEQGVKVSKIVGLADDIKLNLAATDIRIEAPIPGKAAVGIEVPNKENSAVALRDLLETKEFKDFPSNLSFAVGKDIAGQVVVADIARMPHMLIAGATGSGKSVCINTLIMSILYKAHPDDVKLIMIDPKVVELSVYNGIPHLLVPVVTDPKKAAAALHWGVSEMTERYKRFADLNVRDLKGYNKKIETMQTENPEEAQRKMPQIVIIVDELADLMMVAPGEVEESICRLAQLARAAGIHLIIATQRPSVDVITGLIKANMPSRVAFSVSSGVDSRTILDMNGAEKLLGKGDMLFYPQGYAKPARVQGAFVSDKEVSDVVDFLKNQMLGNTYAEDIEEKIHTMGSSGTGGAGGESTDNKDEYFADAGRFIIDKDKASIGMLQRVFKIGFNRAARIMDQLCEYGVVGEEEGTKPRKVLMSIEQFEQLLEEV